MSESMRLNCNLLNAGHHDGDETFDQYDDDELDDAAYDGLLHDVVHDLNPIFCHLVLSFLKPELPTLFQKPV